MWRSFKRGFPKNLLIVLGIGAFYWAFNLVFLGIVNDSCFFGNGRFSNSSIIAYLFAGLVYSGGAKGFDWIPGGSITTWFYNLTLMLALTWLLGNLWRRIRSKGAAAPFRDYAHIGAKIKTCQISTTIPFGRTVAFWMGIAFLLGFFLKSPFTVLVLALWLLLSFGQGGESPLIYLLFIYQGAKNLKNKQPKSLTTGADVALPVFGLGLGFLLDFILILILWNGFDYKIWPRLLSTLLIGGLLLFTGLSGRLRPQSKVGKVAACFLLGFGIISILPVTAYADDGGWTESGQNILGWLANPGTHLMAAAGIGGPLGMIGGWLGNMVGGGVLDAFTGGVGSGAAGTAAGGLDGGPLGLGLGAYGAAMGPLGPVGNLLGNAWGDAIGALGGGGQGGSSAGSSGGGGYGGSSGGSSGGGGYGGGGPSNNTGPKPPKPDDPELKPPDSAQP